jgi:hypothetical protein
LFDWRQWFRRKEDNDEEDDDNEQIDNNTAVSIFKIVSVLK